MNDIEVSFDIQPILKEKTGIGWYTFKIIEELMNYKGAFYGVGFGRYNKKKLNGELKNIKFNIFEQIPYGVYRRLWGIIPVKYNRFFKRRKGIYHFFNFIVPPKIEGKVITTIHDMAFVKYPESIEKRTFNRLSRELKKSAERADVIITVSENSKKDIAKYLNIKEKRIEIIHPGIDLLKYNENLTDNEINHIRKKYKLEKKFILYLGTLEPRKNIESIIEAYNICRNKFSVDYNLVIAGGKGWDYKTIFQKVKDLNLQELVDFTGYVDEEDKIAIYKMSELFIFPSIYEGFGMPVLEAMASGIPVITSNTSALPEVAGDAAMTLDPMDIEQMAIAINKVICDENLRRSMISKGIFRSKKFTWTKSAQKTYEIYKDLIQEN